MALSPSDISTVNQEAHTSVLKPSPIPQGLEPLTPVAASESRGRDLSTHQARVQELEPLTPVAVRPNRGDGVGPMAALSALAEQSSSAQKREKMEAGWDSSTAVDESVLGRRNGFMHRARQILTPRRGWGDQ